MATGGFANPFRPGAGHMPPYLAGRETEIKEFQRLLDQDVILENLVLTGLRGVGKTVLLDTFKPLAIERGWYWVGTDLSESTSLTEERIATRLIVDVAQVTSAITIAREDVAAIGFRPPATQVDRTLDYETLMDVYQGTPGMASDKIKAVLETVWECLRGQNARGLVFAYDEAQNLTDHAAKEEYPLSLMLDVFQSIQKKGVPFMLALTGLPTLFPKLVEARTFSERMFRVVFLNRLNKKDSRDAIQKPIDDAQCPVKLNIQLINTMIQFSDGYPYFIQFLGREVYDVARQVVIREGATNRRADIPVNFENIVRKLDTDFFAGRWARATDRQRDLLMVIARLETSDSEFSVQEITEQSKGCLKKPFSPSLVSQMLAKLSDAGLIYKNRHGKYSFAVPLLGQFIKREIESSQKP